MGNLEKAGVGVVVALLVIIMVVAFTTDPESTEPTGTKEEAEGHELDALRKNDSSEPDSDLNDRGQGAVAQRPPDDEKSAMRVVRRGDDPVGDGPVKPVPTVNPAKGGADPEGTLPPKGGGEKVTPPTPPGPTPEVAGEWPKTHTIKDGDKLWTIAARTYGARLADRMAREIQRANGISDPKKLRGGTEIKLPAPPAGSTARASGGTAGERPASLTKRVAVPTLPFEPGPPTYVTAGDVEEGWYVVQENESLGHIAQQQCGSVKFVDEIVKLNGIKNPDRILAGTRLRLPARKK